MTSFNYTAHATLSSSWLEEAWYDEGRRTLALSMHGNVYAFENVPADIFHGLAVAGSAGTFYRENISGRFGRSGMLGWIDYINFNLVAPPVSAGVATPKGLVESPTYSLTATEPKAEPEYVSLSTPASVGRKFTVTFDVDGEEKSATLEAAGLVEAIQTSEAFLKAFGQNGEVTGVTLVRE